MEHPDERRLPHRRRGRGAGVVVDEHEIGDPFVLHERGRVAGVAGTDGNDVGTEAADLVVAVAQLRGMLAAVQSTEVPQEDEHDALVLP